MFPDLNYQPTFFFEPLESFGVSRSITFNLWNPIIGIGFWCRIVFWASVPEAAIDENGDLCLREDNVRPSIPILDWPSVNSIAKSARMQMSAHNEFRLCVPTFVPNHRITNGGTRSPRKFLLDKGFPTRHPRSLSTQFESRTPERSSKPRSPCRVFRNLSIDRRE